MTKERYVLGFMFDKHNNVLLVEKSKPKWQAGLLNGIGGKIEPHDRDDYHAMRREFLEETGHTTNTAEWIHIATMEGKDWEVEVFAYDHRLNNMDGWDGRPTDTTEVLRVVNLSEVFGNPKLISNLPWLIGMCLDPDMHSGHYYVSNKEPEWMTA